MILNIENVSLIVEDKILLNKINLNFIEGNIYGIFADNGSGKTSFLNALFKKPNFVLRGGNITFNNISLYNLVTHEMFWNGFFYIQQTSFPIQMPYIQLWYEIMNAKIKIDFLAFEKNILEKVQQFNLDKNLIYNFVANCSAGERKLLDIFSTVIFEHLKVIISDEGESNLDQNHLNIFNKIIQYHKKNNLIIILVSHNMPFLKKIKANLCIIDNKNKTLYNEKEKKVIDIKYDKKTIEDLMKENKHE